MSLALADYQKQAHEAVMAFWGNREKARQKQAEAGTLDQGERAGVTSGKNMDGFVTLIMDLVMANGLAHADIHRDRAVVTLPGYFRPTKLWDLLVVYQGRLVAVVELKSQVGPSFGNNFNTAPRKRSARRMTSGRHTGGAFGKNPRPFVGRLMLVEDAPGSRAPVRDRSPHFKVFPEFQGASYLKRYDILCQRLVQEQLYTTAALMAAPREAKDTGAYAVLSELTSLKTFVTSLAGHVAAEAARSEA